MLADREGPMGSVEERVEKLLRRVPPGVTVLAATKDRTVQEIRQAIDAGIAHIGENYVQEAATKRQALGEGVTWHMIGRLQANKVPKAVQVFDWIQTLDSMDLARKLNQARATQGRPLPVLIQVNVGREPQKGGVLPEELPPFARHLLELPHLRLKGLMALPPAPPTPEDSRPSFRAMRRLFDQLRAELGTPHFDTLSMGMSADFEVAVEEGATMIRLGTALFGPR